MFCVSTKPVLETLLVEAYEKPRWRKDFILTIVKRIWIASYVSSINAGR